MYEEIDIGQILKTARLSLSLKIKKVASSTGLSPQTIKNYEEGIGKPKLKNLLKICRVYNINPEELGIHKVKNFSRLNHDTFFIATYTYKDQTVDEIKVENSIMFVNRNEYVVKGNKGERLIGSLYKNRIWNRHIGLGFGVNDIISLDQYKHIINQECYYCGKKNDQCTSRNDLFFYHNGVDRLNSNIGYVKNNVVSCCTKCNMAKGVLSPEEFIQLAEDINNHQRIKRTQKRA